MNGGCAKNGCFIKTRPSRGPGDSASREWINIVTNFTQTWKTACLEMLNGVAPDLTPSFKNPVVMVSMGEVNVHQDFLLLQ